MVDNSPVSYEVLIPEVNLQRRITRMAKQISARYQNETVTCVGVLDRGCEFMKDLVQKLTCKVQVQFVKSFTEVHQQDGREITEIFYAPQFDVAGQHLLLCEGILATGQTTDFLVRAFQARGTASITVCSLLDRRSERRVNLEPEFYGFRVGAGRVAGFGLGASEAERSQPFIFATSGKASQETGQS